MLLAWLLKGRREMVIWVRNRLKISLIDFEAVDSWTTKHWSFDDGQYWLDITVRTFESEVLSESDAHEVFGKITDSGPGENGSLIIWFESPWSSPSCWFSAMVKSNPTIVSASLDYSEANKCFVGSMTFDRSTNTITEAYREGSDLTDDDWILLGHDRCEDCSEFLCKCD